MPTNKVIYGDQTIMDITDTSATPEGVVEGQVFYAANGTRSTGTLTDATTTTHGLMSAADKIKLDGAYTKPTDGIPATDIADGVIPDISGKADSADLATVATTGSYTDLLNHPTVIKGTGSNAVVIGQTTTSRASNTSSVAEGSSTASGSRSHAEGWATTASATGAHSEGYFARATGNSSHAENGMYSILGTVYLTGAANATTYTYSTSSGYTPTSIDEKTAEGKVLDYDNTVYNVSAIDTTNHTITVTSTLNKTTALDNTAVSYRGIPLAKGAISHAEQTGNAYGLGSHAEGGYSYANGTYTHAEGYWTEATGNYSHAEGNQAQASGKGSHAEGYLSIASNDYTHAEGYRAQATFKYAHAEGYYTTASGQASHAEGYQSKATGYCAHTEGNITQASGSCAHAEGYQSQATGENSHAENGLYSLMKLYLTGAVNTTTYTYTLDDDEVIPLAEVRTLKNKVISYSQDEFINITDLNLTNHTITLAKTINSNQAFSNEEAWLYSYSYSEGIQSHAEGNSIAIGTNSHAEGYNTQANGNCSHTEGIATYAQLKAHAEGEYTEATGDAAHAEGYLSKAQGNSSHAEGFDAVASGDAAHAEGTTTTAEGNSSHVEGFGTYASGDYSHAEGYNTVANHYAQHVFGEYNIEDPSTTESYERGEYIEIVGNGDNNAEQSNARVLDWEGNEKIAGDLYVKANADSSGGTKIDTELFTDPFAFFSRNTELSNAGFHNSIYRGKNLGTTVTNDQWNEIYNGTFKDMYIGDYWVLNGEKKVITHFNYYKNIGVTPFTKNHIIVMNESSMNLTDYYDFSNDISQQITVGAYDCGSESSTRFRWNIKYTPPATEGETGTWSHSAGLYKQSHIYVDVLPAAQRKIEALIGASHLLKCSKLLPSAVSSSGIASNWAWTSSSSTLKIDLPNETQVHGQQIWAGSRQYEIGSDKSQLAIFRLNPQFTCTRESWWLRTVVNSASVAYINDYGGALYLSAGYAIGLRPIEIWG